MTKLIELAAAAILPPLVVGFLPQILRVAVAAADLVFRA